jgi:hypothetical protein
MHVKTKPQTLDRAKLFGFSQIEKVKSPQGGERVVDGSAKVGGTENGDKVLWSKIGDNENTDKAIWSKIGTPET